MMIRIEILNGPEEGVAHSYDQTELGLGTASENHVHLTGEGVSSQHARIVLKEDQGRLLPGNTGAVLKINGAVVDSETFLQPGDEIELGSQRLLYKLVPFPRPVHKRRIALLEYITLGALIVGALGQVFFLFGTARSLRSGVDVELLRATATPYPTPNMVMETPTPTPEPPSIIEIPTPQASPVPEESPTSEPVADRKTAAELTSEARSLRSGDLKIERLLREALQADPDYIPAKIELARLLASQADFEKSIALWEEVQAASEPRSMDEREAKLEIVTLKRKQALLNSEVPDVPRVMPTPQAPRWIETPRPQPTPQIVQEAPASVKVGRIRMERFPESPHYDALRMIHFSLEHEPGTPAVQPGKIQAVVNFYEQAGEKVEAARIPEPRIVIQVPQGLSRGEKIEDLSAAYDVPTGKGDPARSYFGAVIQVFVNGEEVTRGADPVFLLELME